jgi:lipid A 3-O-deacylase
MVASARALAAAAGLSVFLAGAAGAQTLSLSRDDPSFLSLGIGVFDALHDGTAAEFRAEYRNNTKLLGFLKPLVGAIVTSDGGAYGYFGFHTDLYFGQHWVLTPAANVGLWQKGNGKDLGSWIEFKTGAEFAYRFEDHSRLGVSFHHISNAGLTTRNGGEESFELVWSIPFNLLK